MPSSLKTLKAGALARPDVREAYDALADEFSFIDQVLRASSTDVIIRAGSRALRISPATVRTSAAGSGPRSDFPSTYSLLSPGRQGPPRHLYRSCGPAPSPPDHASRPQSETELPAPSDQSRDPLRAEDECAGGCGADAGEAVEMVASATSARRGTPRTA